jgi:PAS domain S-box-containing protein
MADLRMNDPAEEDLGAGEHDLGRLLESSEGYRLFVDAVQDYAVLALDLEGRVVRSNTGAERLLGFSKPDLVGRSFGCIFTPDDVQAGVPEQELRKAAEAGRASDDRWHARKDGTFFFANGVTTPLRDDRGVLRGFVKIMRDRTDRKRLEEELRTRSEALARADQEKDEFLSVLAHELRNPLAPVVYALRLLDEKPLDDPDRWYIRRIVDRQMRRLARLIDDLLDVSRVRTGKVELRKSRVDLNALVGHAVDGIRPLSEDQGHTLSVSLPPEPVWVEVDPNRIEQVLANLLSNAVKFTETGGHLSLTVERHAQEVLVHVKDDGLGIATDLLPRIFDLFIQGDRSLDRSRDGLGIGLTLSQRLVELHGGTLEAHSEGTGRGSEFVVRLPAFLQLAAPDEEPVHRDEPPSRPLRVLVVDDSVDTTELLGALLEMAGHSIEVAHTGPAALDAAALFRPDAVILDIGLPGLDGYQVASRLREDPLCKDVMLIAATGYGQEDDLRRSREAGFDRHLVKPIDPNDLRRLLSELANRRG